MALQTAPDKEVHKEQGKRTHIPVPNQGDFCCRYMLAEKKIVSFNAVSLGVPTMLQGTEPKCTWPKTLNLIKWLLLYCEELPQFQFYWWGFCHISFSFPAFTQSHSRKTTKCRISFQKWMIEFITQMFFYIAHRLGILQGQLRWAEVIRIYWFVFVALNMVAHTYNLFN